MARRALRKEFQTGLLEKNRPHLVIDTETGGRDAQFDALIEVSYAIIINRFIPVRRQILINDVGKNFSSEALKINGFGRREIEGFLAPHTAAEVFKRDLFSVIKPYEDVEYCIPVGHNIRFDLNFVERWMRETANGEFYDLCIAEDYAIDTLELSRTANHKFNLDFENHKLGTVADYYGVLRENAHSAKVDVEMTIDVLEALLKQLKEQS